MAFTPDIACIGCFREASISGAEAGNVNGFAVWREADAAEERVELI